MQRKEKSLLLEDYSETIDRSFSRSLSLSLVHSLRGSFSPLLRYYYNISLISSAHVARPVHILNFLKLKIHMLLNLYFLNFHIFTQMVHELTLHAFHIFAWCFGSVGKQSKGPEDISKHVKSQRDWCGFR